MRRFSLKKAIINTALGTFVLVGGAAVASAQNTSKEYIDWQKAQAKAQREYQDYLRTRSQKDYRQWQDALRKAERERAQYQAAAARTGHAN